MAWDKLTRRERECAILLIGGEKTRSAAYILGLSPRTVEVHRAHLLAKFGVRNLKQLKALDGRPADFEASRTAIIDKHERYQAEIRRAVRRSNPRVDDMLFLVDSALARLVGATVLEVVYDDGYQAPMSFPVTGLKLKLETGEIMVAWILQDPEGKEWGGSSWSPSRVAQKWRCQLNERLNSR